MRIHFKLEGRVFPATLVPGEAAQALAALLPLTVTMYDLFGREKLAPLPGRLPPAPVIARAGAIGDLIGWAPGSDLSVVFRSDGARLEGAMHYLGRLDFGAQAFARPGPVVVTIERGSEDALAFDRRTGLLRRPDCKENPTEALME